MEYILRQSKLCLGPMSINIIDSIIDFSNKTGTYVTFIPSRRQIEWNGGYVNNWTTEDFSNYIKSKSRYVCIQRDHGGPGQGSLDDDGYESLKHDCKFYDSIHIDPWKKYSRFADGLKWTIDLLNFCYQENPNLYYEVGTEEAIRKFTAEEVEKLLYEVKKSVKKEIFERILFCVIQSGTALKNGINTGNYNDNRLIKMINVVKTYKKLSKEHNGDYMDKDIMIDRFSNGLDSLNIAPELGVVETKIILEDLKNKNLTEKIELFYKMCLDSDKWKKWVSDDFIPENNKEKLIEICGHYVFSHPCFNEIKMIEDGEIKHQLYQYLESIYTPIDAKSYYTENRKNVLTNEETMEDIFSLKEFPISMSCVPLDFKGYKYLDMVFQICKKTGIIQIKDYPSLNDMYIVPHNMSYGKIWDDLFELMSKKIDGIVNKSNILEIGGGSLLLASKILKNDDISSYVVYEKNSSKLHTNDERISMIKEYFTDETEIDFSPDIIIHSHVLEHVCYPNDFISVIKKNMKINGYHCFIVPNLQETFKKKYANSLNFEHNVLISEPYINVMLHNNNFEIIDKEYYLDHSIIYITRYIKNDVFQIKFPNMYEEYRNLGLEFKSYYENIVDKLNKHIDEFDGDIYLFGGHIFSQYLIKFGLNTNKILNILDNSKEKENHKLYGFELVVKNPSIIEDKKNVAIIVKAATYQKEIEKQLYDLNENVIIFK